MTMTAPQADAQPRQLVRGLFSGEEQGLVSMSRKLVRRRIKRKRRTLPQELPALG